MDERQKKFKQEVLHTICEWANYNIDCNKYTSALVMCKEIIESFDDNLSIYQDDNPIWDVIRMWKRDYEKQTEETLDL